MFLADAAVERFVMRVRVDVDQPRHDQPGGAVDRLIRRAGKAAPDKADPVVGERDIDAAAIHMLTQAFIPRDRPGGIFDDCGGHWLAPAASVT